MKNIDKITSEIICSSTDLGDVADFLGQCGHIFESIEKGTTTGSGDDPLEIIKKQKYSKGAKDCLDYIHTLMENKKEI